MEKRTFIIILGIAFFVLLLPFILFVTSFGNESKYWKIENTGLLITQKDSLRSDHYYEIRSKDGLDTSKFICGLIYFDTEFYQDLPQSNSMLSAARKPGYLGNSQKINFCKIMISDYYKNEFTDVTTAFNNDSTQDINILHDQRFYLYKNYHGTLGYHEQVSCVFNNLDHFKYLFNQSNSDFDEIGDENVFLKFNIDKTIFNTGSGLFKLKLLIEFSDKKFQRIYYGRLGKSEAPSIRF